MFSVNLCLKEADPIFHCPFHLRTFKRKCPASSCLQACASTMKLQPFPTNRMILLLLLYLFSFYNLKLLAIPVANSLEPLHFHRMMGSTGCPKEEPGWITPRKVSLVHYPVSCYGQAIYKQRVKSTAFLQLALFSDLQLLDTQLPSSSHGQKPLIDLH